MSASLPLKHLQFYGTFDLNPGRRLDCCHYLDLLVGLEASLFVLGRALNLRLIRGGTPDRLSLRTPHFTDCFRGLVRSVSKLYLRYLNPLWTETQAGILRRECPHVLKSKGLILKSTRPVQSCFIQTPAGTVDSSQVLNREQMCKCITKLASCRVGRTIWQFRP